MALASALKETSNRPFHQLGDAEKSERRAEYARLLADPATPPHELAEACEAIGEPREASRLHRDRMNRLLAVLDALGKVNQTAITKSVADADSLLADIEKRKAAALAGFAKETAEANVKRAAALAAAEEVRQLQEHADAAMQNKVTRLAVEIARPSVFKKLAALLGGN